MQRFFEGGIPWLEKDRDADTEHDRVQLRKKDQRHEHRRGKKDCDRKI